MYSLLSAISSSTSDQVVIWSIYHFESLVLNLYNLSSKFPDSWNVKGIIQVFWCSFIPYYFFFWSTVLLMRSKVDMFKLWMLLFASTFLSWMKWNDLKEMEWLTSSEWKKKEKSWIIHKFNNSWIHQEWAILSLMTF